jgi:MYXO-CTERM domain-containing protein
MQPMELIVDNLDPQWEWSDGIATSIASDAWRTKPSGALSWWGRTGTYCTWNTPDLPFSEPAEYEVFTWVASENPDNPGTYYNRDANAIYTIRDAFGVDHEFVFSQQDARGLGWVSLGKYWFSDDGTDEYVRITSGAQSGQPVTSYDAVRWLWTPPPAPIEVIPEPAGLGLIGLALLAVRRRRS